MAKCVWTDHATSLLLEALQSRESLWNIKAASYRNRNVKQREYTELKDILHEEIPEVDLAAIKAKIQSLRTSFREEVRKIKKSEGTGSGADDVYVPKWKFFQECAFLQDVISSNRPTFSNLESVTVDDDESSETTESERSILSEEPLYPKRAKKTELPWMETAATALNELAKGTLSSPKQEEDEWDVFGRDVANSIRSLGNVHWQRRVKFAVQSAIFQGTEQARPMTTSASDLHYGFNNPHDNSDALSYHRL